MPHTRLYWLHTLSPTHAGIGRGVGYIDLPIDRDGVTHWPILRGSGFKGVWADHHRATEENRRNDPLLRAAFGVAGDDNHSNAGALIPTDAKLVCLPVRSFRGTFAWATSPLCLSMLRRTLQLAGVQNLPAETAELAREKAHYTTVEAAILENNRIYLEDLDIPANPCPTTEKWATQLARWVFPTDSNWQSQFVKRFVLLPNDYFDFLCETGTEVHTRVRIDDDMKTVARGALWTEEALPAETILMGLVQCDRVYQKKNETPRITEAQLLDQFAKETLHLQIGGKATVGRGQVRCVFTEVK